MNHENRLVVFMLLFLCVPSLAKARARIRDFVTQLWLRGRTVDEAEESQICD